MKWVRRMLILSAGRETSPSRLASRTFYPTGSASTPGKYITIVSQLSMPACIVRKNTLIHCRFASDAARKNQMSTGDDKFNQRNSHFMSCRLEEVKVCLLVVLLGQFLDERKFRLDKVSIRTIMTAIFAVRKVSNDLRLFLRKKLGFITA